MQFSLEAYKKTMNNPISLHSIWISVLRTVLGTGLTLLITFLAAYPLSKEASVFRSRNVYSWLFVFSMIFNGGLVPFYMVIQKIHLMDSFWVLVLPGAVNTFLVILMLNFFRGIPKEMEEAALIDGAGHLATFLQTVIIQKDMSSMSMSPKEMELLSQTTVNAPQIFIGAAPILIVYPFLQNRAVSVSISFRLAG